MPSAVVDILIPTYRRPAALAITLTAVCGQIHRPIRVIVSDQSEEEEGSSECPELAAVLRVLRTTAIPVDYHRHLPRRGMAEQRQFLIEQARAPYALFLDDDVMIEPDLVARLVGVLQEAQCGFVGSALIGPSYVGDVRPHEQALEFWEDTVRPELLSPGHPAWQRHRLHNAANLYHVQCRLGLTARRQRLYKVAWVGGCVLYDVSKLRASGAFEFWSELPDEHAGEDVLAQLRVMARFGGAGLIPSGAYHLELPTTVRDRRVDAPKVLPILNGRP